jgi:6-pyruvoyl-tetrahydropterin synthase
LDPNGFGVDISVMESVLELTLHEIDDRLLNDLEYFSGRQPSLENLAVYLEETLRSRLKQQSPDVTLTESSVQIWESQTAWARYSFEETT